MLFLLQIFLKSRFLKDLDTKKQVVFDTTFHGAKEDLWILLYVLMLFYKLLLFHYVVLMLEGVGVVGVLMLFYKLLLFHTIQSLKKLIEE